MWRRDHRLCVRLSNHLIQRFEGGGLSPLQILLKWLLLGEPQLYYSELLSPPGAPFDPRQLLDNAVSNVICTVVFGKRYNYGDPEFLRLLDLFSDNFRIMSSRWGEVRRWALISPFYMQPFVKSQGHSPTYSGCGFNGKVLQPTKS